MHQSTLLKIISALPADKLEAFALFLASPYFNTNTTLCNLFAIIQQGYPEFDSAQLGKEDCFAVLFPGKTYKAGTLRNLMTRLTALLREFLIQERLKEEKEIKDRLLLQQYSELRLEKSHKELYKKRLEDIDQHQKIDQHAYLWRYLFLREYQESALCDFRNLDPLHIQKSVYYLDRFILIAKMNMQITINSRIIKLNESAPTSIIKFPIQHCIEQLPVEEKMAFDFVNKIICIQTQIQPKKIPSMIDQFKYNGVKYSNHQNHFLLRILTNLTTRANSMDGNKLFPLLNSLIKYGINNKIILSKGNLNARVFINVIHCAIGCGNFTEAQCFLEKNIQFVPESKRKEVEVYSSAAIQFCNNKFDDVSHKLSTIQIRDSALGFHYRLLMMKNAIELAITNNKSARDGLLLLDSIDKYIRRKAHEKSRNTELFLNFIKVARRLFRNMLQADKPNSSGLQELLNPDIPLAARQWLTQKINEL